MKINELIKKLKTFNKKANVKVIANNREYDFTLCWGGPLDSEGTIKRNVSQVSFYVDALCESESN